MIAFSDDLSHVILRLRLALEAAEADIRAILVSEAIQRLQQVQLASRWPLPEAVAEALAIALRSREQADAQIERLRRSIREAIERAVAWLYSHGPSELHFLVAYSAARLMHELMYAAESTLAHRWVFGANYARRLTRASDAFDIGRDDFEEVVKNVVYTLRANPSEPAENAEPALRTALDNVMPRGVLAHDRMVTVAAKSACGALALWRNAGVSATLLAEYVFYLVRHAAFSVWEDVTARPY